MLVLGVQEGWILSACVPAVNSSICSGLFSGLGRSLSGEFGCRYFIWQLSDTALGLFVYRCDRPLYQPPTRCQTIGAVLVFGCCHLHISFINRSSSHSTLLAVAVCKRSYQWTSKTAFGLATGIRIGRFGVRNPGEARDFHVFQSPHWLWNPPITVIRRLTMGIRSEKCIVVRTS